MKRDFDAVTERLIDSLVAGERIGRVTLAGQLDGADDIILEALRPFAKFACDTPHVNEPVCHNCRARNALAKQGG